jgi:signal transduction histidine kinase
VTRPVLFPTGLTILKAIVVGRWLALVWMAGIVVFDRDELRHVGVAWLAVAVAAALTVTSSFLVVRDPARLMGWPFVVAEVGLALGLSIADGFVFDEGHVFATTQSLATQWPLLAMATAGVATGPLVAAALGVLVGPAEWLGAVLNGIDVFDTRQVVSIVATSIFYAACGGVFGWLAQLLRRAETEIADRRARDEVARVMHDTVLQTLALVERRTAETDPDLAMAAHRADLEVRSYLFGGAGQTATDLGGRVRAEIDRVRAGSPIPVSVSVIDDDCELDATAQDLVTRAVGQAVANALEHASPSRVVVFAETVDDGGVFASVDDDGSGFDPALPRTSHGIDESIIGRVESIGGRVEIRSRPGGGTEVCIWVSPQ